MTKAIKTKSGRIYTKRQIREAIAVWKGRLRKLDEDADVIAVVDAQPSRPIGIYDIGDYEPYVDGVPADIPCFLKVDGRDVKVDAAQTEDNGRQMTLTALENDTEPAASFHDVYQEADCAASEYERDMGVVAVIGGKTYRVSRMELRHDACYFIVDTSVPFSRRAGRAKRLS